MPQSLLHCAADAQPACSMPVPVSQGNPAQERAARHSRVCFPNMYTMAAHRSSTRRSRPWCAAVAHTVALLLLLAALLTPKVEARKQALKAATQPCIECSQCLTASCQRICSPSCRGGGIGRGGIVMNGDQCKYQGEEAADAVADDACRAVQGMCQAGTKSALAFQSGGYGLVSASECAAIANGACQRAALNSQNTPCGVYLYFGFRSCSGRQFTDMYKSRVIGSCRTSTNGY